MSIVLAEPDKLAQLCERLSSEEDMSLFLDGLNELMPDLSFSHVTTRSGWHRLGGVVDSDYKPVAKNIVHWAEEESDGDVDELIARFMDEGYFATKLSGRTLYFTASAGDHPEEFIQLEVEHLQEVLDRRLIETDWFPESIEEFLDPLECPRLVPEPVASSYFQFRRIVPVSELITEESGSNRAMRDLVRFFKDWKVSSANEDHRFCDHWVLALREYMDSNGDSRLSAKPTYVFNGDLPELPDDSSLRGLELANAIHEFDRQFGYPFAWFFMLLNQRTSNYRLAEAVLKDLKGAYDYLPAKDVKVLSDWERLPYAV